MTGPVRQRRRAPDVTDAQVTAWYRRYAQGRSADQVADEHGVSQRTVLVHFHRLGLPVRRRGPRGKGAAA